MVHYTSLKFCQKTNTMNIAVKLCKAYSNRPKSVHILWKFHQNLKAGNFKTNFWFEIEWNIMLLLCEFFFYQCIGNQKLRGLARPLNVIQSSYNFAGFTSMFKTVVHNVWPVGHIWPGTSPDVVHDVQQEKRLFQSRCGMKICPARSAVRKTLT